MAEQKTKQEILDHIVEYYKINPRAVLFFESGGSTCTYKHKTTGARCAHSICIDDDFIEKEGSDITGSASALITKMGDEIHKPEFRGHSKHFWNLIQQFHDERENWTLNEQKGSDLTTDGVAHYNRIVELLEEL